LKTARAKAREEPELIKQLRAVTFCIAIASVVAVSVLAQITVHAATLPAGLDVQPFPGTPDASPQTEIAFPALAPSQLRSIVVTGSRSGVHRGRLTALPHRRGSAFIPSRRFASAERVTVRAALCSGAAGTPAKRAISFSFGVSAPLREAAADSDATPPESADIRHDVRDSNGFTHSFRSEPSIHPPIVWLSGTDPDPGSGYIFGDAQNTTQPGPMILDPEGRLVWFLPLHRHAALNVQVQRYQGRSVLTFWDGYVVSPGIGVGTAMILDHSYQTIATVNAGHGYQTDLHEFQITPQGTALLTAYAPVSADLRSVGGPRNGVVLDSIIQEIDIASGTVLWEWHAYGHVRLGASYAGKPTSKPYDFFHVNSVQQLPDGNLLVSARHTWSVYEVDKQTGRILWTLGGRHSNFKVGQGVKFEWQHDAQMQPDGTITVFDNGAGNYTSESQSRALRIGLDFTHWRATLVHAYAHNPPLLSENEGSTQVLPDGNTFVGWGNSPYFSEFHAGGRQLFSVRFDPPLQSYRAYRFAWWGQPTTPPSIAVAPAASGTTVYASWNGATTVAAWQVLAGPSAGALTPAARAPSGSFETAISTSNPGPYYAMQALASDGRVLATSAVAQR
jgi:hypothetical protein